MDRPLIVTIVETAHHFLYLPVQYAVQQFTLHPEWFGCAKGEYKIRLRKSRDGTDVAAYDELMRAPADGSVDVSFAVADPAVVLNDRDTYLFQPVVLASLVTNASFWAVDRRSFEIRFLRDLARFDKIISFPAGTTAHGIATRIYRDANKVPSIESVEPGVGKELTLLTSSKKGTMALTPDLLGVDELISGNPGLYHVDLALGATPEYNNVLVTAFLTRTDVPENHPKLVQGLLAAIQQAMLLVRFSDPKVIEFAVDAHGSTETRVTSALNRAADAQIFPATIEVSKAQWLNAARAAADTGGRIYDDAEHDRANHLYRSVVEHYQRCFRSAIRVDILPLLDREILENQLRAERLQKWVQAGALGVCVGMAIGGALWGALGWPAVTAGLSLSAAGVWLTSRLKMNGLFRSLHAGWLIAGIGVGGWWTISTPTLTIVSVIVPLWLGVEATIVTAAASMRTVK